jgi:hypothetical protein
MQPAFIVCARQVRWCAAAALLPTHLLQYQERTATGRARELKTIAHFVLQKGQLFHNGRNGRETNFVLDHSRA